MLSPSEDGDDVEALMTAAGARPWDTGDAADGRRGALPGLAMRSGGVEDGALEIEEDLGWTMTGTSRCLPLSFPAIAFAAVWGGVPLSSAT